jgi:UDP-N-acetylmuramate-alanine ligase
LEGQTLANVIAETHQDVHYMQDDEKLIDFLTTKTKEGDAIVFLGSHGFRGMIESLVSRLSK